MGYHTELDGCGRFMKYVLFFINFIIFLAGLAIMVISIVALVYKVNYISYLTSNDGQSSNLYGAVYVLLVAGIVTTVVSFFGCYGAMREIKCMLLMYALILLCLTVVIAVAAVLSVVYQASFKDELEKHMYNSMNQYQFPHSNNGNMQYNPYGNSYNPDRNPNAVTIAWDALQTNLECCGTNGVNDWNKNYGINGRPQIPESCCKLDSDGVTHMRCNNNGGRFYDNNTYLVGCLQKTKDFMEKHAGLLIGIGFSGAILTLIGLVFSIALFRRIR